MFNYLKQRSTIKGIISIVAAGAMMFTPDHIDTIIETSLSLYGIDNIMQKDGNDKR